MLETSAAIYEADGSYAVALFTSSYCKFLDMASRNLCMTADNAEALACGKWLCHQSCWTSASRITIETGDSYDLRPCEGGINIYAVPIKGFGKVIGSLNFGYGSPPSEDSAIGELAEKYQVDREKLKELARGYKARPDYIIEAVKRFAVLAAELIGEIYERKKLEGNLTEKEQQLHAAFDFSTIAIAITSVEKGWIDVNNRLCQMLGYPKDELMKMTWIEITHPEDIEPDVALFNQVLDGKMDGYEMEKRFIRKDDTILYTKLWLNCRRNEDESVRYCVALIEDISERKALEEELNELTVNLKRRVKEEVERNREKDQLMYEQSRHIAMGELLVNIGHQWRQPLTVVGLLAQDILDAYLYNELNEAYIRENIKSITDELMGLSKTIDNFKSYYITDPKKTKSRIEDEINNTLSLIDGYFRIKGVKIYKEFAEGLTVNLFPNEFAQVILNILNNIKDVFEERCINDGTIKIKTYKEPNTDKAVITISDNGGGVSEDIIGKIFDPYFTTKHKSRGTGLGLYFARVIIEKSMKGSITARNVNGGCELRIEI
ncbi:MAG: PAS domain S-box protein [Nitrospirae bacterium]|nr:PAS domain S-box protein [Nitrospirota bacterium]